MESRLQERWIARGEALEAEGRSPFLLAGDGAAWLVDTGTVELFHVRTGDGRPGGSRFHLATLDAGSLLLGLADRDRPTGGGLIAVGQPGTRLHRINRADLVRIGQDPALRCELVPPVGRWITALLARLCPPQPYAPDALLRAGVEVALEAGQCAAPGEDRILCVASTAGAIEIAGSPDLILETAPGWTPLPGRAWIRAPGPGRLVVHGLDEALDGEGFWESMDGFHRLILRWACIRSERVREIEIDRIGQRDQADRFAFCQSIAGLGRILDASSTDGLDQPSEDHLLEACRVVCAGLGVEPVAPPTSLAGLDPLDAICRASRMRSRLVMLDGRWWRDDAGPLLGFRSADGRPVALCPLGPGRYELFDPIDRSRHRVDARVAAGLGRNAYCFYRPFPDRKLTSLDIVTFALRDQQSNLLTILMMGLLAGALSLITPVATGTVVDSIIPVGDRTQLLEIGLLMLVILMSSTMFGTVRAIALIRLRGRSAHDTQAALWDRVLSLPSTFFRQYSTGDLALRVGGVDRIREELSGVVLTAVMNAIFSVFQFGLLFHYSPGLAGVATLVVAGTLIFTSTTAHVQRRYTRELHEADGKVAGLVFQIMQGIDKIRVAGAEVRAFQVWSRHFTESRRLAFALGRVDNFAQAVFSVLPILSTGIVFYGTGRLMGVTATDGPAPLSLTTGQFLAFSSAFGIFYSSALALGETLTRILNVLTLWERARPIIETPPESDRSRDDPGRLEGRLEVSHVHFRYRTDGPLVLHDVSIRAEPGEFIALVGPSGSGKSSLLRLLLGLETPESGSIFYDGRDLTTLDTREVRRQIGVVMQNDRLQAGDIFSNIVGSSPRTLEDAWEAARMAGLEHDLRQMPMGMQTMISEDASTLSGGQRQRLMIARALIHKPRIIFFDEATSALDNRTQSIVSRSLANIQATRIAIAHRLSTIREADRIYVLEKGAVVESGTLTELMEQDGLFARLARRQLVED